MSNVTIPLLPGEANMMRKAMLGCVSLIVFLGIAVCAGEVEHAKPMRGVTAEATPYKPGDGALALSLRSNKSSFRVNESIAIEVSLLNVTSMPIYLYADLDWGESASLSLHIRDAVSKEDIAQDFIADAVTPPPQSKDDFVKVTPHHLFGVVLTVKLQELNLAAKGSYELIVEYHSPIPSSMSFGLPIWTRDRRALFSPPLVVHVDE